jgi:hypothetical protein
MQDERRNESIEDLPKGDGTVSDEDVNAISGGETQGGVEGGQDHSTETREDQQPSEGVGAQPNENDRQTNISNISE